MSNFYTEPFVSAGEMEFPSEPYITAQPQNHTAPGPEEYVLKVIAAGAVSYQWEVFDGESWSTITGATSDSLTISIDSSMNGWRYRVLVTGADGSTVISKAAQIAVKGVHEITLEGAIVTFTGPARIKSLEVEINAVQSGSGDPSPTNIRPISGWDSVNVVRTGKNLLDPQTIVTGKYYNNAFIEITNADKAHSGIIKVKPSTSYCLNGFGGGSYYSILALDADKNPLPTWYGGASKTAPFVATLPSTAHYVVLNFNADQVNTIAFYESATVDGYIEYQGTTYPITLPNTCYGGKIKDGVLTVTNGYKVLDGTTTGNKVTGMWTARNNQDASVFYLSVNNSLKVPSNISDSLAYSGVSYTDMPPYSHSGGSGASGTYSIALPYDVASTVAEANEWLAEHNVAICYKLATPIEITLSDYPTITTLTGINNMWADSGDIIVTIIR